MRLIDADALKKRIIKRRDEIEKGRKYGWEWVYDGLNIAIVLIGCEMVENPVDAREDVKTGKWIYDVGGSLFSNFKCSVCEEYAEDQVSKCEWNFCPNCGADMRGEQDE